VRWNDKTITKAKKILSESRTIGDAARKLGVSYASLTTALCKVGIAPGDLLAQDPLERHAAAAEESKIRREHRELIERVKDAEARLAVRKALDTCKVPKIKRRELSSGLREGTAVALFSDVHCEERVEAGDTPTGNTYSLAVSDVRIGRFFAAVEWLIRKERTATTIRDVVCWLGGDLMSGQIHDENVETSELAPIPTLLWLYPRIVDGLRRLAEDPETENILVPCSYGNHGRDTKTCRFARGAHHSYEWGMYQRLADEFRDHPKIRVYTDTSEHQYVQVYDYSLHFHHGHRVNYGGGVGGITIPINKAVAQWDRVRRCDYHHFGHFHQYIDTGNVVVNGSVIGYNSYAMGIKASPEPPQQAFYVLDSKRGKTAKSPIWVAES
jgi:hypothetical protein